MQILKENKDKKDAEFNERFKHSECSNLSNIIFFLHLAFLAFSLMEENKYSQRILLLLSAFSLLNFVYRTPQSFGWWRDGIPWSMGNCKISIVTCAQIEILMWLSLFENIDNYCLTKQLDGWVQWTAKMVHIVTCVIFLHYKNVLQSKKEYERQIADEEAQQLLSFQVCFQSFWTC